MADTFRAFVSGAPNVTIDFSAIYDGYKRTDAKRVTELIASDGTVYRYLWGSTQRHEISMNNVSLTDATHFNTWWNNETRIHFTPDLINSPGVTISARIVNTGRPFQVFNQTWQDKFEATLIIQQVESGS